MSGGNIKVVVRCRPLNAREIARGSKELIRMEGSQTILDPPEATGGASSKAIEKKPMIFSFDKSYWSAGPKDDPRYASQQTLYEDLGADLLDHSFEGFNTCIFAYGQTGSGKSYSMMGYGAEKGIIPLTTSELFRRIEARMGSDVNLSYTVEVSYIEIYNEKVRDLLNPKNKGNLRVREHPSLGPYVEDLSRLVVENYTQMMTLMDEGNKARTVASTNMNETSSRSHAVFTLVLTQKRHDPQTQMTGEKVSKISLVDLAGSERQASTGATGTRLKEGANINKSLTTLGKVISALAQAGQNKRKKEEHVPYRDSVLTWLLKESLGGNSKTAMIAAISPADYEETLSTLRYADAAKKIKTHAIVNEDPNAKLIRELKEELELLRSRVLMSGLSDESSYDPSIPPEKQIVTYITKEGEIRKVTKLELQDQLEASEKLMESLNLTWEEKLQKTQAIHIEREKALEELGISIDTNMVGVHAPQNHPSLVNLNEDPLMSECLIYQIKPGTTIAGAVDEDKAHIKLSGTHILPEHCSFTNDEGVVTIEAMPDARTFVNGKRVPPNSPVKLLNGFRVILGDSHVFRFNDPAAVRAERKKLRISSSTDENGSLTPGLRPDSPSSRVDTELMDWTAARREVADIEKLADQDLDKLYDDILKLRTQRRRPESRMDIADFDSHFERSANPLSNPWAGPGQTATMTSNSLATPVGPDVDVNIVDEQSETSAEQALHTSSALQTPAYDQKAADAKLHQEHLTKQLRMMAQEVKRIRSQAARAKAMEPGEMEPADWNAEEVRKLRRVVEKWKRLRGYKMAEEILLGAVDIREANIIAKHMEKQVTYNFLVVNGAIASPTSSLDEQKGIIEFEDVSGSGIQHINGPVVVVKVIDWRAKSVYTWDLPRFRQQLIKMRHMYALKEKPNYSVHFEVDGPFTDVPPPSYSFIGSAKVPLRLLGNHLSYAVTVPIMCQYTMEAVGSCRVTFKADSLDDVFGRSAQISSDRLLNSTISPGSRLVFTFIVDSVKGLSSTDYASIHAQTRLSSLIGPSIVSEDTFASQSVDLDKSSGTRLILKKTISTVVTPEIIQYITNEYAVVEFFAKAKTEYLERLERWDVNHEVLPTVPTCTTPTKSGGGNSLMRRCETDFVAPERHDILATISILELASSGEYLPAEVYDDIFQLHQGLQRRLRIKLVHSSGKALPWEKLEHVSTGDIRLVDKSGAASVGKPLIELRMSDQVVEHHPDGTLSLEAEGVWDTASHACRHLDRRTLPGQQHLLIRLTWLVSVPTLSEPVTFQVDLPLKILGRDAKRSSFLFFWSASKVFKNMTRIFVVECAPPIARSANELWRLDTGGKHVKGEETLGNWKPRSLGLLDDWKKMCRAQIGLAEVAVTKIVLEMWREDEEGSEGEKEDGEEEEQGDEEKKKTLMGKCLGLWQKAIANRVEIDVKRESLEEEAISRKLRKLLPDLEPKPVPTVKLQRRIDNVIKSGHLMLLRDSQADQWEKIFFVLRPPYLHVHESAREREVQVINLTGSYVATSPEVEMLLKRRWAFTVFTPTNSYILQAASENERKDWISVISTSAE
ncbi:kinesin, putative [Cryptococcus deneoformans JEC21]|uniref:Kinesin, putative n=1 Tax=Cryptococcus deneoformans (strain JEC21 / ATCC MYA-565) TaxID=214684 RepID=Q5KNG1_CRYD1|nr:kinesin, putative [Cryptococcus neoformans var. neoformans JEC21]AAW41182.2 kinesin, putative [Cryptococcus neoformans var. neoformans JEC21]